MADANSIVSRKEAKALGLVRYFTGKVCPSGHLADRYTSTSNCVECLIAAGKKNKDAYAAVARARHAAKRAAILASRPPPTPSARQLAAAAGAVVFQGKPCAAGHDGTRYVCNGQCTACISDKQKTPAIKEYKKAYGVKNKEAIAASRVQRYVGAAQTAAVERATKWRKANPEKRSVIAKAYKARRRATEEQGDSTAAIFDWEISQKKVCHWCGAHCAKAYHVDHYQPLAKGGQHEIANLVIACPPCNLKKNAKDPYEFAASKGRLF